MRNIRSSDLTRLRLHAVHLYSPRKGNVSSLILLTEVTYAFFRMEYEMQELKSIGNVPATWDLPIICGVGTPIERESGPNVNASTLY